MTDAPPPEKPAIQISTSTPDAAPEKFLESLRQAARAASVSGQRLAKEQVVNYAAGRAYVYTGNGLLAAIGLPANNMAWQWTAQSGMTIMISGDSPEVCHALRQLAVGAILAKGNETALAGTPLRQALGAQDSLIKGGTAIYPVIDQMARATLKFGGLSLSQVRIGARHESARCMMGSIRWGRDGDPYPEFGTSQSGTSRYTF